MTHLRNLTYSVSSRLSTEDFAGLAALAQSRGRSIAWLIRDLILREIASVVR